MATQLDTFLPRFPYSINSSLENRVFLVAEQCHKGIYIRLSAKYGHKLKGYWQVWAREVLLKLPAKYYIEIRISGDRVYLESSVPLEKWFWTANNLLATLTPLPDIPMFRRDKLHKAVRWNVWDDADLSEVIASIRLPDEAERHFRLSGGVSDVHLRLRGTSKKSDRLLTLREVAQMVELQVALTCRNGYPKATDRPSPLRERKVVTHWTNSIKTASPTSRYL